MYEFIQGTLHSKEPLKAVVEAGGIGYRLTIPLSTYQKLPSLQSKVELYLSQIVREDHHALYAFISKEERDLFEMLLNVSGIGPKTASAIVGHIDIASLHRAVSSSDTRLLSKIPGIGKKTAERLVLELRDVLKGGAKKMGLSLPAVPGHSLHSDALGALVHLGYAPTEAHRAVSEAIKEKPGEADLGRLIAIALQKI
jgi:Holliday junction DNA helicase RuvA